MHVHVTWLTHGCSHSSHGSHGSLTAAATATVEAARHAWDHRHAGATTGDTTHVCGHMTCSIDTAAAKLQPSQAHATAPTQHDTTPALQFWSHLKSPSWPYSLWSCCAIYIRCLRTSKARLHASCALLNPATSPPRNIDPWSTDCCHCTIPSEQRQTTPHKQPSYSQSQITPAESNPSHRSSPAPSSRQQPMRLCRARCISRRTRLGRPHTGRCAAAGARVHTFPAAPPRRRRPPPPRTVAP